ncbi:MAG: hypothetical protein NZL85_09880 [Fimbriimonadales bacterium]|nr:hypothetical protein [Fimbriimonadales bacterium]
MEAFDTALRELLQTLRQKLIANGAAEWLQLARLARDASIGAERLSPSTQEALLNALQAAHPLAEAALTPLLEAFGAHQKAIQRAAAQVDSWRYPASHDLLLANERMSLAPPLYDSPRLERALLLGTLTPPDADASQRAQALFEAVRILRPFEEYNRSTAFISVLAFLRANGFDLDLTPEQAAERLTASAWQPLTLHPISEPEGRTFSDLIELLVARYRDALGRAERALREQSLVQRDALPARVQAELHPAPGPTSRWRYLTVQDLVWINTQITGTPQPYNYDRLEEATYYQYSYRQSMDVLLQAARFLWGYLTYRPFAKGNLSTALIGVLTFLEINGFEVRLPVERAAEWLLSVAQRRKHPLSAIRQIAIPHPSDTRQLPVRDVAHHLIEQYEMALHRIEADAEHPSTPTRLTVEQP